MERKRRLARFRSLTRNVRTSTTVALWVCLLVAIGLLTASFIVPPTGEFSPSVLKAGSLVFAFAAEIAYSMYAVVGVLVWVFVK